jgi:hypothetical protein
MTAALTLAVIGAGFPRTGTASLKAALEMLGFGPCYHMSEVFAHPGHWPMWTGAAEGRAVDWDAIYAGYRSAVDAPGCFFYRQIAAHYPDAKIILTSRDPEAWFSSTQETVLSEELIARRAARPARLDHLMRAIHWHQADPLMHDKDAMIARLVAHNDDVRRTVAPERLLEFDSARGWELLCAFLGVPVPRERYPHINKREGFRQMGDGAKEFDPESVRKSHARQLAAFRGETS